VAKTTPIPGHVLPLSKARIASARILSTTVVLERFHNSCALASSVQGGIYFHPSDEDLSLGARLKENATRQ